MSLLIILVMNLAGCVLLTPLGTSEDEDEPFDAAPDMPATVEDMRDLEDTKDLEEPIDAVEDISLSEKMSSMGAAVSVRIFTKRIEGLSTRVNTNLELEVEARDARGGQIACVPEWTLTQPLHGELSEDGVLTPLNTGPIEVNARCDDALGTATISSILPDMTPGTTLVTWLVADRGLDYDQDGVTAWTNAHDDATFSSPSEDDLPRYRERVPELNDYAAVEFSSHYLAQNQTTMFTDTMTIITVVRGALSTRTNYIAGFCNTPSLPDFGNHSLVFNTQDHYELNTKATVEGNGTDDRSEYFIPTAPSSWHVRSLVIDKTRVTFHEDGTLIKEQAPEIAPLRFRMRHLGGWCSSTGNRFTGEMAELFFIQGALAPLEREAFEFYLLHKYGL